MYDSCRYTGNIPWLKERTILAVRHGSRAYGTNIETSDHDFKGIVIAPKKFYLGLSSFEHTSFKDEEQHAEAELFEFKKFVRLAQDCNPNIIEILWVDPSDRVIVKPQGQRLINARRSFMSRKIAKTFVGFAVSRLQHLKRNFSCGSIKDLSKDAYHVIRLLTSCLDALETGELNVRCKDPARILMIRNGQWSLDSITKSAEDLIASINCAVKKSPLPEDVDREKIDEFVVGVVAEMLAVG